MDKGFERAGSRQGKQQGGKGEIKTGKAGGERARESKRRQATYR